MARVGLAGEAKRPVEATALEGDVWSVKQRVARSIADPHRIVCVSLR